MAGVRPGTAPAHRPALSSRTAGGTGRGAALSTVDVEARTQQLGRALLAAAERYRPGPAERVQDWLLTHAVADDRFRSRLLRYLDVLASVDYDSSGAEAKRLAHEYFGDEFPELPRALRWFLRIARNDLVPARIVGESARRSAERFARRFITRPGAGTVRATTALLANHGRVPSFDLLGEAVLSDPEAEQYLAGRLVQPPPPLQRDRLRVACRVRGEPLPWGPSRRRPGLNERSL